MLLQMQVNYILLVYLFVCRSAKAMSLYIVFILDVNVLSARFKNKRVKDIPITTQCGLLSAHIYNLPAATCIMHLITCQSIFVQGRTVCKNISLRYQICPLLALYEINLQHFNNYSPKAR
jgi:hypothetical protein